MSATQLAAWIVGAGLAAALAAGAAWLTLRSPPCRPSQLITGPGLMAVALGLLALVVLGLGVAVSSQSDTPGSGWSGRCGPGLYDNGGVSSNGPVCIPWKGQMP